MRRALAQGTLTCGTPAALAGETVLATHRESGHGRIRHTVLHETNDLVLEARRELSLGESMSRRNSAFWMVGGTRMSDASHAVAALCACASTRQLGPRNRYSPSRDVVAYQLAVSRRTVSSQDADQATPAAPAIAGSHWSASRSDRDIAVNDALFAQARGTALF